MDTEDIFKDILIIAAIGIICIAATGIICTAANIYHDKEIELEKYKIEMQIKHGDINIESEK